MTWTPDPHDVKKLRTLWRDEDLTPDSVLTALGPTADWYAERLRPLWPQVNLSAHGWRVVCGERAEYEGRGPTLTTALCAAWEAAGEP